MTKIKGKLVEKQKPEIKEKMQKTLNRMVKIRKEDAINLRDKIESKLKDLEKELIEKQRNLKLNLQGRQDLIDKLNNVTGGIKTLEVIIIDIKLEEDKEIINKENIRLTEELNKGNNILKQINTGINILKTEIIKLESKISFINEILQ